MTCVHDGCNSVKIRAKNLCSLHWQYDKYGRCKNGCLSPSNSTKGLCSNCIKRGGVAPQKRNNGKCNKCETALIKHRCPTCDINRKKNENLIRRYGISLEQFNSILTSQDNVCKICSRSSKRFVVDHDHGCCETRKTCGNCIRGIICENCNRALGLIEDSKIILNKMIGYLEKDELRRAI